MPWTEEQIVHLLNTNDRAVERAIVALYERQTADEKSVDNTRHDNKVGFRKNHASRLSKYARLIKRGCRLYPMQLSYVRPWMVMYRAQLASIANAKEAAAFRPPSELTPAAAAKIAQINAEEDAREAHKEAMYREPPVGSRAATARMLAQSGVMTGDEADRWKDEMKDAEMASEMD